MSKTNFKTKWSFNGLYKSLNDPQIEKDFKDLESAEKKFAKKYSKDKKFLENPKSLKEALDLSFKISGMPGSVKPIRYFSLQKESGNKDPQIDKKINQYIARGKKIAALTLFFDLELGKVSKEQQSKFIKSKELEEYKYFLERFFLESKHQLSEPEEKILMMKSNVSSGMWVDGVEKSLYKKTVNFKNKELPLPEASSIYPGMETKDRRELFNKVMEACKSVGDFAESEINAVYTNKKINDELRGFKNPYSATIMGYENDEKRIIDFVNLVTKNFKIAHKFHKLKKKVLRLSHLEYADRSADIGKINKKFDFETSTKMLLETFENVDPEFSEILERFLNNGQIDVFPKAGKTGGAFCSSNTNVPTVVMLNHTDDFNSLNTFAHEMGHAIHGEFSKKQPVQYEGYTISVAETASTLFENLLFDKVFESLNDKEKVIALHDKIQGNIASIFRQIACFNFENELHRTIREQGYADQNEIANILNKNMKAYLGPDFKLKELDGYFFVQWSHIRRPFYVYSYAFGELISAALYEEYKRDKKFIDKIKKFLSAGGSKSPYHIFKDAGIDINNIKFFELGLKKIEKDIDKLAKLIK